MKQKLVRRIVHWVLCHDLEVCISEDDPGLIFAGSDYPPDVVEWVVGR